MYAVWIRIDETLPWIELKGDYPTKREARKAAAQTLGRLSIKVVNLPERKPIKATAMIRIAR